MRTVLLKGPRNRVRLKNAEITPKENEIRQSKTLLHLALKRPPTQISQMKRKGSEFMQESQILTAFSALGNENAMGMSDEGMRLAEKTDSFFADPIAARPQQRVLHSTHYFAPAVHKFLPAQHRYPDAPHTQIPYFSSDF